MSKPSKDQSIAWWLPLGLAGFVAFLALNFVGNAGRFGLDNDRSCQVVEMGLCLACIALIGWGYWLTKQKRGSEHLVLRDRLLVVIGLSGFLAYFNFGHLHFNNLVHVWDTYHYHMGAKYFPELNYERLYDCTEVVGLESGRNEEVAKRTITNLRNNLIEKTDDLIANPDERCKRYFTPERWDAFKADINTYRSWVNEQRWTDILHDHGYNATPVWTLMGLFWTNTLPVFENALVPNIPTFTDGSGTYPGSVEAMNAAHAGNFGVLGRYNDGLRLRSYDPPWTSYLGARHVILLNLLDPIFLALTCVMVWWAFGPRGFAIAALVLGCNFPNRYYWTGGAFLRHDWIFFLVASICLLKKDKPYLAGAAFAYATLLRLFPGLAALGPAIAAIEYWRLHRKLDPTFVKYVAGGLAASMVLVGLSAVFVNNRVASVLKPAVAQNGGEGSSLTVTRLSSKNDEPITWIKPPTISFDSELPGFTSTPNGNSVSVAGVAGTADPNARRSKPPEATLKIAGGDPVSVELAPGDSAQQVLTRLAAALEDRSQHERAGGGLEVWQRFKTNTVKHANTPLTNHMGLRTVLSWRPSTIGARLVENGAMDPWARWKQTRLDKWEEALPLFVFFMLAAAVLVYLAIRNSGATVWLGAALGIGFIPFGAELTNYYYCFLMGIAVLHSVKREVGLLIAALAAATLFIEFAPIPGMSRWLDEQYVAMSIASLVAVTGIWWCFTKWGAKQCVEPEPDIDPLTFKLEPAAAAVEAGERKKKKRA